MYCIDPGEAYGRYFVIGSRQTDVYEPLYARIDDENVTTTRWKFSEAERQAIANGADVYLFISRPPSTPLQPVGLVVGGPDGKSV